MTLDLIEIKPRLNVKKVIIITIAIILIIAIVAISSFLGIQSYNEKISIMTKLALYEQKNAKSEIKYSKYYRSDYLAIKMIKSFVAVTIAYALMLALWLMFSADAFIGRLKTTNSFMAVVILIVMFYILITVVYMIFTYIYYSKKFSAIRENLNKYNGELKVLHKIQEEEYDAIINSMEERGEE